MLRKIATYFILLVCLAGIQGRAFAQVSYIYMQADKEDPFDIKLGGKTTPCAGKQYCIISDLTAGTVAMDVVFRQGVYPNQHFTVLIPKNGNRQFRLIRKGTSFSLYDLQQHFYIPNENTVAQDQLPGEHIPAASQAAAQPTTPQEPAAAEEQTTSQDNSQPQFINDITLTNNHTIHNDASIATDNEPAPVTEPEPQIRPDTVKPATKTRSIEKSISLKPVRIKKHKVRPVKAAPIQKPAPVVSASRVKQADNSEEEDTTAEAMPESMATVNKECPNPMNGNQYDNLYLSAMQKAEKDRLSFLTANLKYCFSTNQVSLLAKTLGTDEQRYTFLEKVYTHISDQYNFNSLEDLLTDEVWKAKFHSIQK